MLFLRQRRKLSKLNKNLAYEAYKTATLQNGWTGTFKYAKNAYNQVKIYMSITAGTISSLTVVTSLPAEYRPTLNVPIQLVASSGDQSNLIMYLSPNGNIYLTNDSQFVSGRTYLAIYSYYMN